MQKYKPFLLILFILSIPINFFSQDFKTVHDGVEYAEVTRKLGDDPVKINLLRLDLKKVRLDVHHALDAAIGTETTSSIAKRKGAVAAINAGFFRLDTSIFAGDAANTLVIDGEVLSESTGDRIALEIVNTESESEVSVGRHKGRILYRFEGSNLPLEFSGVNRERKKDEVVLYTPKFGVSSQTPVNGTEILLASCKPENKSEKASIICKSVEVKENSGNNAIPENGFVVSTSEGNFEIKNIFLKSLKSQAGSKTKSKRVFIFHHTGYRKNVLISKRNQDVVGGLPQLIKNGKIDISWEQEKAGRTFVENRHPRTAIAKMKDGKFLMITVDGRQPGVSVGMDLNELAGYLLEIGAMDAMNLDGGGSTTMFLDGKVVNKPSGTSERQVSDAILVTRRKKR